MTENQDNIRLTDGQNSLVQVDNSGCLLVCSLQEWLDTLVPTDAGLRVMDPITKKKYILTRIEE